MITAFDLLSSYRRLGGTITLSQAMSLVRVASDRVIRCDNEPKLGFAFVDAQDTTQEFELRLTTWTEFYLDLDRAETLMSCLVAAGRTFGKIIYRGTYYGQPVKLYLAPYEGLVWHDLPVLTLRET